PCATQEPAEPQRTRTSARNEPYAHGATAMNLKPRVCLEIEGDLVAAATGDAEPGAVRRVEHHIDACASCRGEFRRYREIDGVVGALRRAPAAPEGVARAREGPESPRADLQARLVSCRVFPFPP